MRKVKKISKKMGRPREENAKRATLAVRMDASFRSKIAELRGDMTEAEFVRRATAKEVERLGG